jgi:hypothetical protein
LIVAIISTRARFSGSTEPDEERGSGDPGDLEIPVEHVSQMLIVHEIEKLGRREKCHYC